MRKVLSLRRYAYIDSTVKLGLILELLENF
jgi:hypothetical protein